MLTFEIVKNILLAILLGSLIGLQREYVKVRDKEPRFAGFRTFMLISLLGSMSVYLSQLFNQNIFLIITAGYMLFVIFAYVIESYFSKNIGATTELSSIIVYFIGVFCAVGKVYISVFIAIATTTILALKENLHTFAFRLKEQELYSTLKFAIIAFVILPLLPNKTYGPYDVLNPYVIWLMVVLISGISFIAYILIKLIGAKKGLGIAGLLGGLISSTAITTGFSSQSRRITHVINPFVVGIVVASSTMFVRVLIEVSVLNRELLKSLIMPLGLMAGVGFLSAMVIFFKKEKSAEVHTNVNFSSPFTLSPALKFGILFGVILFISKAGQILIGSSAIYGISFLSGLADVDAITVSMANLSKSGAISQTIAASAITLAAATNTLVKAGIVYFMGSRAVSKKVAAIFLIMLLSGLVSVLLV